MRSTRLTILAESGSSHLFAVPPEVFGVVVGPDGAIYFGDVSNHRIFRIEPGTGTVGVAVGCGEAGNDGDGGPAVAARITQPYEVRFDADGHLFFVDMLAHVVRRVDRSSGVVSTVAGQGVEGYRGDGGPAIEATLARPHSIEFAPDGAMFIADIANHRLRRVDPKSGLIDSFAGTGEQAPTRIGESLDGNPVNGPRAVAFSADGAMVLGLREGNAIYRVEMSTRVVSHIAGTGKMGYSGDGGDARKADLAGPKGIALQADGGIVLADTESHTVRRINPEGRIETLAGNGIAGDATDPAGACMNRPHGVIVQANGAILVGDSDNRRLLRLEFG